MLVMKVEPTFFRASASQCMHYASSLALTFLTELQQTAAIEPVESACPHRQWSWQWLWNAAKDSERFKLLIAQTFKEALEIQPDSELMLFLQS
jgi:hypothetical protein